MGNFIGIIIDAVIVAVSVLIVVTSRKRGAVKTIMSLLSGVAALLLSYAFTPVLSAYLKNKFFLEKFAKSIMDTVASLSSAGKDAAENVIYDVSRLVENSQFLSVVEKYGGDPDKIGDTLSAVTDTGYTAVEQVSYAVADPIAKAVSDVVAFGAIFVISLIVLKIVTLIVSAVFKLPVLKTLDKTLGGIFGIITAVLFVLVFAMVVNTVSDVLTGAASATFPENFPEKSLILRFLSKYNAVEALADFFSF